MNYLKNENGIAIILSLIMLLVMSVLGLTVAFMSNINFQSMSNFKRGQESFLAAESCINIARNRLEQFGVGFTSFSIQADANDPIPNIPDADDIPLTAVFKPFKDMLGTDPQTWEGPFCRTGPRLIDPNDGFPKFINITESKAPGRDIKDNSTTGAGFGGVNVQSITFTVTGKDSNDADKVDKNNLINTGTEIAAGFEVITIGGGAPNLYN